MIEVMGWLFGRFLPPWSSIPIAIIGSVVIYKLIQRPPDPTPVIHGFDPFSTGLKILGNLFGGLFFVACLAGGFSGWRTRRNQGVFVRQSIDIRWLNGLSWQDFEKSVADVYRHLGYKVEIIGGGGADGGIDLRMVRHGETTLVQCKKWRLFKVGVQPVRELYGVMAHENAQRCILITSGIYTDEALRFSEGKPMELVDGAQFATMMRDYQAATGGRELRPRAAANIATATAPTRPTCPACNSRMILRRAKTGPNAGREFWGCSTYPKCRGIVNLS